MFFREIHPADCPAGIDQKFSRRAISVSFGPAPAWSRSKRLKQAHDETNCTDPKQKIPPRKIPGDGELRKECVTEETSQREKEPDP
jgi:hypothetical protein